MSFFQVVRPVDMLGKSIKVFLKAGGSFYLKVTGYGPDYISGLDDEGIDLVVKLIDIDYTVG